MGLLTCLCHAEPSTEESKAILGAESKHPYLLLERIPGTLAQNPPPKILAKRKAAADPRL